MNSRAHILSIAPTGLRLRDLLLLSCL